MPRRKKHALEVCYIDEADGFSKRTTCQELDRTSLTGKETERTYESSAEALRGFIITQGGDEVVRFKPENLVWVRQLGK